MKKFDFRLERILRLKRQRERQAELRQAQEAYQDEMAHLKLRKTKEELKQAGSTLATRPQMPDPSTRIAAVSYLAQMQHHVETAEAQARKTQQLVVEANNQRAKVHREVEG